MEQIICQNEKTDWRNRQKGIEQNLNKEDAKLTHLLLSNENCGMNHSLQLRELSECLRGISLLPMIFEALRNELKEYPDDLPTSFVSVETEIAKCICKCFPDVAEENKSISQLRCFVRDIK